MQNSNEMLKSMDQVAQLIDTIKKDSFPELAYVKISLGTVNSDSVFLESRPVIYSLFLPFKVKYKITINPKLFQFELPLFALAGILAHELAHTSYYVTGGRMNTILTGLVFLDHSKHINFERRTDVDAITRGYGEGIKAYREIVFKGLTAEQKKQKNERYFSVEEIDAMMAAYATNPELKESWLDKPPLNLASLHAGVNNHIAKRIDEGEQTNVT